MSARNLWTREELIVTLGLYFQLPFGRLNHTTKEVKELAKIIGRTDNSVALRLVNFAACDPYILESGRHGMASGAKVCKPIWDEFVNDKERLFVESEQIRATFQGLKLENMLPEEQQKEAANYVGEDRVAYVKTRVNQNVFRHTILGNYENKCAICGINVPELLVASHIIPWAADSSHRLDPSNGLCLSSLYDKAFDQGLLSVDPNDFTVKLSKELQEHKKEEYYDKFFGSVEHQHIIMPIEYLPNPEFLQYHIDNIFKPHN